MDGQDFSFPAYQKLLSAVKRKSLVVTFEDAMAKGDGTSVTIVRHDIDLCLVKALQIAKFEHQNDIKSTFFIMTKNPLYSLEEGKSRTILREIEGLGHDIGLHFDPHIYEKDSTQSETALEKHISTELNYLAQFTSTPPSCLSFHRPSKSFINGNINIAGVLNAYSPYFMEFYISDSSRFWRCGCPVEAINSNSYGVGQVLTHPLWWNEQNLSAKASINLLCERMRQGREDDEANIRETIRSLVPKVEF